MTEEKFPLHYTDDGFERVAQIGLRKRTRALIEAVRPLLNKLTVTVLNTEEARMDLYAALHRDADAWAFTQGLATAGTTSTDAELAGLERPDVAATCTAINAEWRARWMQRFSVEPKALDLYVSIFQIIADYEASDLTEGAKRQWMQNPQHKFWMGVDVREVFDAVAFFRRSIGQ